MTSRKRLSLDDVYQLSMQALQANGAVERNAEEISHVIWAAERDGCHSHGLFRLPWYVGTLRKGRANGAAQPRLEDVTPTVVRVHAVDRAPAEDGELLLTVDIDQYRRRG